MAKNRPFFRFGRRALDAAGNFLPHTVDHGSTDIFEAVIYIHRPWPTRTGLAVGCFYVKIERLSSRELFLISVLTIFSVKAHVPPRTAACRRVQQREQIILKKRNMFSRVPHSGGTSVSFSRFLF